MSVDLKAISAAGVCNFVQYLEKYSIYRKYALIDEHEIIQYVRHNFNNDNN